MQRKYLTEAIDVAKELEKRNGQEGAKLIAQIE